MPSESPAMGLPYIEPSQAQKHVTHNEALRILDAATQLSVLSAGLVTPPTSPTDGDRPIVGPAATGDWSGQDDAISVWSNGSWFFVSPRIGWRADLGPDGSILRYDGTDWVPAPGASQVDELGVNTTADATNRLAVSSDATLLTHAGAGHQLKINKDAIAQTASLLFQTGWSGRAEMGTTGSDDFTVKVSDDGSTFRDALVAKRDTGAIEIPQGQLYFRDIFIADDAVHVLAVPFQDPARILMWIASDQTGHGFLVSITGALAGALNFAEIFAGTPGSLTFQTGPLTGATGPDASLNLSIDTSGADPYLCIENRLGFGQNFVLATLGR